MFELIQYKISRAPFNSTYKTIFDFLTKYLFNFNRFLVIKQNFITDVTQSIINMKQINIDIEIQHKKN